MDDIKAFLGTWTLVSYEARDSTGRVQYPLGEHVTGQLIYDAGGNMSVHIMRLDRPIFASRDSMQGTDTEVLAAFEGHASYFGTYMIDPIKQTLTHHVKGASYPNWIGSDQLRCYKFDALQMRDPRKGYSLDRFQEAAIHNASCPTCRNARPIHADKIISITEDISEGSPAAVFCM